MPGFRHTVPHGTDLWLMNEARLRSQCHLPGRRHLTYKDLEHGAFELITEEAVPRHIIVDDSGVTVVLRPKGPRSA